MRQESYVLILAGGSGTRLWPLSREDMPKQFLSVCGRDETLLQLTVRRMLRVTDASRLRVVASGRWRSLISYQLMDFSLPDDIFIDEPEGRNTAPAIALGLAELIRAGAGGDDVVLVCPSDHLISDEAAFADAAERAFIAASRGRIVTFGIKPTYPETGFGYIKTKGPGGGEVAEVEAFVEKPDLETAEGYVASGSYYWNGGYFCFRVSDMTAAFEKYFPESAGIFSTDSDESRRAFLACPKISMDYAIMEKIGNIACVPMDAGWSDVGSWDAVYDNSPRDESGNVVVGNLAAQGLKNSIVIGGERLICCIDVDSMIVVDTPDALLIAPRGSSQKLPATVRRLPDEKYR